MINEILKNLVNEKEVAIFFKNKVFFANPIELMTVPMAVIRLNLEHLEDRFGSIKKVDSGFMKKLTFEKYDDLVKFCNENKVLIHNIVPIIQNEKRKFLLFFKEDK